jgi:hypothetical protein
MPYNSQYAPQIARLLMEQGQTAAQQQADRGRIWGGAVQGIGQQVSRRLSDLMREKQEAPIRAQQAESRDLTLRGLRRDDAAAAREVEQAEALKRAQSPEEIMQILGPERGPKVLQGFAALKEQNQKSFASTQQLIGTVAMANKALPEPMRQEAWDESISMLAQRGLITPEDAPKTPDEAIAWVLAQQPKKTREVKTRAADGTETIQIVEDVPGKTFTSTPEVKKHKVTVPGPDGKPLEKLVTEEELTTGVEGYRAPTQPAQPPPVQAREVLDDNGTPVMATFDPRARTWTNADGKPIKNPRPVPSAIEMMDSRKFEKAGPVLASIDELSEKINTQAGLIAKLSGGAEKAKAKANYNDDVAEYQALVSGFTPLIARSLGHTGVLTQQDVDSVKELFPKPGDSKTLRDRKLARIKTIIGALEQTEGAKAPAAVTSGRVYYDADGNPVKR